MDWEEMTNDPEDTVKLGQGLDRHYEDLKEMRRKARPYATQAIEEALAKAVASTEQKRKSKEDAARHKDAVRQADEAARLEEELADADAQVEGGWSCRRCAEEGASRVYADVAHCTVETVGVGRRDESVVDSVSREVDVIGKIPQRDVGVSKATRGCTRTVCEFDRTTASAA